VTTEDTPTSETGAQDTATYLDVEENPAASTPGRRKPGWIRRPWLVPAVVALFAVAAAAVTVVIYFTQYRPDQQTDAAAASAAVQAAKTGTEALLSYSPNTLDHDFSTAESHLTGDFLTYYTKFTQEIVTPAAKQKGVTATANVVRAAVSQIHPTTAVVLVYINQTTVSTEKPDPELTNSSVLVTLDKNDNKWLISKFEPV
jgi:Mce-associated membrane protein